MKTIIGAFLAFFIIPFSYAHANSNSNNMSVTEETVNKVIEERELFGINSDATDLEDLILEGNISLKFGVHMTDEEEQDLSTRLEEQKETTNKIQDIIKSSKYLEDNYLGSYIDQASGGDIFFGFKPGTDLNIIKNNNRSLNTLNNNSEIDIVLYHAEYSEDELDEITSIINKT
ncbi:hypothetical protein FLK61_35605 [Paenalkalicoccus suaedae]|uniref:Uncharacterized protein n=1 Tax=Paenalkalicoccus suaedae TaxID=2592382 RepID=A0A859FG43_9BACI|nr:hypothetical protein [Paenalkalicoccus suaedae]QKS71991.1 hypothetical protein FLK61_35605 [Paenalkalicoccus suaedae]